MADTQPVIAFEHFGFQYNAQAEPTLYDIDLTVHQGETVLIAGPSGCGKSTIIHCINGLVPHSYPGTITGRLTLFGRDASKMSIFDRSQKIGTVLQDSDSQFVGLTVAEDIAFALENDCIQDPELKQRVLKAAKLVDISHHMTHAPTDLSGGQKQRVAIGGVMVDDVDVLLFDEPLANLDPAAGKLAMELIHRLHKETRATVIIIEHRLEDVLHCPVDRIVLMADGRIVSDTPPDQLLSTRQLSACGVREPLYLDALRYAGLTVTPQMHPASARELMLTEGDKAAVRSWFSSLPPLAPQAAPEPLLEVTDLSFTYDNGFEALKDISLTIGKGELLAIVGKNGAGKSTFSKVVCGFETPQKGTLRLHGKPLQELSIKQRADSIGYVMQNPNQMICEAMIYDEVALGLRSRKVPEEQVREKVEAALQVCGLYPFRNWPVSALSFGQKKRVTIASILALDPEMIILDEPTAGQDFRHYTEIMEFLLALNARGLTVVMITHDMHLMLEYARRAVVFSGGRIIADDTSASILTDEAIIKQASLKETSLFTLAVQCGIEEPREFVRQFIAYDREVRSHGSDL